MALPRMARAGVRWRPSTALVAIGDHEVTLVDTLSLQIETVAGVDTVVIRTHGLARRPALPRAPRPGARGLRVGDAVAVRLADRADLRRPPGGPHACDRRRRRGNGRAVGAMALDGRSPTVRRSRPGRPRRRPSAAKHRPPSRCSRGRVGRRVRVDGGQLLR